jgi:hypothetical protein
MAEAIFGWVDNDQGRQIAGRVYVGDAHVTGNREHLFVPDASVLLSGPKPTSFQHYLTQSQTADRNALQHYDSAATPTLRGHKLYWHKGREWSRVNYHDATAPTNSTQHTRLRPVAKGTAFEFDVRFENLLPAELGAVLWVTQVGGSGASRLKLGMGKPLGLGTVRIDSELELSDRMERYRNLLAEWTREMAGDRSAFEEATWKTVLPEAQEGVRPARLQDGLIRAFEQATFKALPHLTTHEYGSFRQLPRIQMLLKMLAWEGPSPQLTDYMALMEFKDRRVLPDPLHVGEGNVGVAPHAEQPSAEQAPEKPTLPTEVARSPVCDAILLELNELPTDQLAGRIMALARQWEKIQVGDPGRYEVAKAMVARVCSAGREPLFREKPWYRDLLACVQEMKTK